MKIFNILIISFFLVFAGCRKAEDVSRLNISGIYPHLAFYNNEGECGTGALVPWAGRLWAVTYGPHLPFGSSDKLYEITPELKRLIRSESVGGTPANRMIHRESNKLFIGPYSIDSNRNVSAISPQLMPGRMTGNARHLSDPSGRIYYLTMEEGLYEVDVNTLEAKCIYRDGNPTPAEKGSPDCLLSQLPGAHGKGSYSGQGILVYSNNGELSDQAALRADIESGSLNEWNGQKWKLVRRNQFVEVTGPGGIYGNTNPATDPIWATGWDHKSLLLGVRDHGKWSFYRLPKASHSYDGAHGWNTEWPRIRDVGTSGNPSYLMTMHGMFWNFPSGFSSAKNGGIRPLSAYLKVIGDFCRWNDKLVFGCDDAANREFLNTRKAKGGIVGPGQSNSNLWFISSETTCRLGPNTAEGAVWSSEEIKAGERSEPLLFAGWDSRSAWIRNEGNSAAKFTFEADIKGDNLWVDVNEMTLDAGESSYIAFDKEQPGEWIRVYSDKPVKATVHFWYAGIEIRPASPDSIFNGLSTTDEKNTLAGLLWGLGDNKRRLGVLAGSADDTSFTETGYYELDSLMNLVKSDDAAAASMIREKVAIPQNVVSTDSASVVIDDDKGRRWRLPKGSEEFKKLTERSLLRICREVATERDLFNCSGTFYELPAENADGFARIRPVSSHNYRIYDYASYRGLLVMTGISPSGEGNEHIFKSDDGKAALWAGTIDDLWKMGKPVGEGGPWFNSAVKAGIPSDPYLAGFYDKRTIWLSHDAEDKVSFMLEADPSGNGQWMTYMEFTVEPDTKFTHVFPNSFQARWIRVIAKTDCRATVFLKYE